MAATESTREPFRETSGDSPGETRRDRPERSLHPWQLVLAHWLASRSVILLAMWGIAPLLKVPEGSVPPAIGWQAFAWWDGEWYLKIATQGYDYIPDASDYSAVAFFPFFPLAIRALASLGLSPTLAGVAINNAAFFAALLLLYHWLTQRHGRAIAHCTIIGLAWCPYSLYGSTVYTEGLFLLVSIAALRAYERQQVWGIALFGALATATRATGIALIPALGLAAWRDRRSWQTYWAIAAIPLGIALYSFFCWQQFGAPLAFVRAQAAWGRTQGLALADWWKVLMYATVGVPNYDAGRLVEWGHPLAVAAIAALGAALWQGRERLGAIAPRLGCLLVVVLWLLGGDPFLTLAMVWGGAVLLGLARRELGLLLSVYGWVSWALVLSAGRSDSSERLVYSSAALAIAFGVWLARHRRWVWPLGSFMALVLATLALRFAQQLWVA